MLTKYQIYIDFKFTYVLVAVFGLDFKYVK